MTYPEIEAWASFSIYAGDLSLDVVEGALGVRPDSATAKGTVKSSGRVQPVTHWSLDSDGKVDGADPDVHLRSVLDRIEPAAAGLAKLRATYPEVATRVWVMWSQEIALAEFTIAAETLARVAALGAGWSISVMTPFTEEFTDDEEDVIGVTGIAADGTVVVESEGEVDSVLLDDHVRFLIEEQARTGASIAQVVFRWILERDDSNPEILREQVVALAALGAPVRVIIGARP
jgi:hypothetical protein